MTHRRSVVLAAGVAAFTAHTATLAQPAIVPRRVGFMTGGSAASAAAYLAAFKQGLAEWGWIEGKNIAVLAAYASGDIARFDALARDLVAQGVELIVTGPPEATQAAHAVAPTLPIVMAFNGNVVKQGFVASLARPGGVITGLNIPLEDMRGKAVEILHELLPRARRVAVLLNGASDKTDIVWTETQRACQALGLQAQRFSATHPAQIEGVVEQIVKQRAEAVVVPTESLFIAERVRLHALLQAARLPAAYSVREHAEGGGLFSYGANVNSQFRYAAKYVDKILRGAKPADLPVEQPTQFELVINLRTAKALGLTVPSSLLLRADEVIR